MTALRMIWATAREWHYNTWSRKVEFAKLLEIRDSIVYVPFAVTVMYLIIQLQAWTDPEGSRRLKLSDFKTIGT